MKTGEGIARGFAIGIPLAVILYGGIGAYEKLDQSGWLPHHPTVELLMSGEWLEGESRQCVAHMNMPLSHPGTYSIWELRCPAWTKADTPHTMPIYFWGKTDRAQPNVTYVLDGKMQGATDWRCVRGSDKFSCYALD